MISKPLLLKNAQNEKLISLSVIIHKPTGLSGLVTLYHGHEIKQSKVSLSFIIFKGIQHLNGTFLGLFQ